MTGGAPPEFGDPDSMDSVARGALRTATTLRELVRQIEADIRSLTGIWSGTAAQAWQRRAEDIIREMNRAGDRTVAYSGRIAAAGETMRLARQTLDQARAYAAANRLVIRADLRVVALEPWMTVRRAQAAICQQQVEAARKLAAKSRQQIATANEIALERLLSLIDAGANLHGALSRPRARPNRPGMTKTKPASGDKLLQLRQDAIQKQLEPLSDRIDRLNRPDLMDRWHRIDPADPKAFDEVRALRKDVESAEDFAGQTPQRLGDDDGLTDRKTPGGPVPEPLARGNFVHLYADELGGLVAPDMTKLPAEFAREVPSGRVISIADLPPGLPKEVELGVTARADRILVGDGRIYEIKSMADHPKDIFAQADRYAKLATDQKFLGIDKWESIVVLYDPAKAATFVKDPALIPVPNGAR
jgi:uncharacterized protein YukE